MTTLGGVIFDFDGVLVDSERAHFESFRRVLVEAAGFEITFDEYADHYLAYDDHGAIQRALQRHSKAAEPDSVDGLALRKKRVFAEALPEIGFLPGAPELIESLAAERVPLAIASGARREEIVLLLESRKLLQHFRGIVSADEVVNFKPHPEPYLRAGALLGADVGQRFVAIEDSPTGMAAARAASLTVVGVTNSYPRERLNLAHWVVESLLEITPQRLEDVVAAPSSAP